MKTLVPVLFAVACAATIILLAFGLRTHAEAGLLKVCWDARGPAVYDEARCGTERMENIHWAHMPITVDVTAIPESDLPRAQRIVLHALRDWNQQLGFAAFTLRLEQDGKSDLVLVWGSAVDTGANEGGSITHAMDLEGHLRADGSISAVSVDELAYRVTFHELGHAIGLAHDDFPSSPMYPTTFSDDPTDTSLAPVRWTHVTDYDRALLRRLYVPGSH